MANYQSKYTGQQIDEAVGKALQGLIGNSGEEAVSQLPTPTDDLIGKTYFNLSNGRHYKVVRDKIKFNSGETIGNKIYLDTTKDPMDYIHQSAAILMMVSNGTYTYALIVMDVLAWQEITDKGHCWVMAFSDLDSTSILGIPYVDCDVLSVDEFNEMFGGQYGISITKFDWQTDQIDTSSISDYPITENHLALWHNIAHRGEGAVNQEVTQTLLTPIKEGDEISAYNGIWFDTSRNLYDYLSGLSYENSVSPIFSVDVEGEAMLNVVAFRSDNMAKEGEDPVYLYALLGPDPEDVSDDTIFYICVPPTYNLAVDTLGLVGWHQGSFCLSNLDAIDTKVSGPVSFLAAGCDFIYSQALPTSTGDKILSKYSRSPVANNVVAKQFESITNGQIKHYGCTVTLNAVGWNNNSYTIATSQFIFNAIGNIHHIIVSAKGDPTVYAQCNIYLSSYNSGGFTFKCTETPIEDIAVNVLILHYGA